MKKIYTVVEEWNNCADYPEDLCYDSKILVSTNSVKKAKQIILERRELAMSYLDTIYLNETEYEVEYDLDSEWSIVCRMIENKFGIEYTYCGDSYCWRIIENHLIED